MLDIPVKHKKVTLIWYSDLEDFIELHYGKSTNMARFWEASQNTIHDIEVDSDPRVIEYWDQDISDEEYLKLAEEELSKWINYVPESKYDEATIDPTVVLWDLCRKGKFPKGNFKVEVWW